MKIEQIDKLLTVHTSAIEVANLWIECNKNLEKRHENSSSLFESSNDRFHGSFGQTKDTLIDNKFTLEDFFENKWNGKLREDLSFLNAKSKKRKRNLSEHDGDFDFDRLWDIKLFNSTRTEPYDNRVIVDLSFDISCWFSKEDIREYGKLCYHVVNFIEEHGYVCDINLVMETSGTYYGKNAPSTNLMKVNIKQSSDYQDNISICKYFTDWFYRRCMFNLMYQVGKEQKFTVCSSLGSPTGGKKTEGTKGYLYIAPLNKSQIEGKMDFTEIKKAIEISLGG